eukprot:jgi/Ulvmu1/2415/UM133_0016.1
MLGIGLTLIGILLACMSRVSGQTASQSTRCLLEGSQTSACVWTGGCSRDGCSNKCITNAIVTRSWLVLLDRSTGESFYSACPTLARWVNLGLSVVRSSGRRLLELTQNDAVEIIKAVSMGRRTVESVADRGRAASRSLLNLSDVDSPAPSPATSSVSADIPSNVCPTPAEVEEASRSFVAVASIFSQVFNVDASGEPIPSELADFAWILEEPNTYQWLAEWLVDADRVAEYISKNCASETIENPQAFEYRWWLDADERDALDSFNTMVQCVDTFGAYDQFEKDYKSVKLACDPPFGVEPDCFTEFGHYIVTSPACAAAYATMFNVTDATPLISVAANVNNIQDACAGVTNEMECLQADTPVLNTIEELHSDIPILWPLDIVPVDPFDADSIPLAAPVCFGDDCPDPAQEPGVKPPDIEPSSGVSSGGGGPELLAPPINGPVAAPYGPGTEQVEAGFDDNGPAELDQSSSEPPVAASAVAGFAVILQILLM